MIKVTKLIGYFFFQISPSELEKVVAEHPSVKDVCVVGVPHEDGHIPKAFVTVNTVQDNPCQLAENIKLFANSKLSSYKQLGGGVVIIDELPRGKTGKVSRKLLEAL